MTEASKSPGCPDPRAILQCKQTKNPPREVSGREEDRATALPAVVPTTNSRRWRIPSGTGTAPAAILTAGACQGSVRCRKVSGRGSRELPGLSPLPAVVLTPTESLRGVWHGKSRAGEIGVLT